MGGTKHSQSPSGTMLECGGRGTWVKISTEDPLLCVAALVSTFIKCIGPNYIFANFICYLAFPISLVRTPPDLLLSVCEVAMLAVHCALIDDFYFLE